MGRFFSSHQWVAVGVLLITIGLGGLYSNCGSIETDLSGDQYRQKIFIDEVQDVFPERLCSEDCEAKIEDGTLMDVEFE